MSFRPGLPNCCGSLRQAGQQVLRPEKKFMTPEVRVTLGVKSPIFVLVLWIWRIVHIDQVERFKFYFESSKGERAVAFEG